MTDESKEEKPGDKHTSAAAANAPSTAETVPKAEADHVSTTASNNTSSTTLSVVSSASDAASTPAITTKSTSIPTIGGAPSPSKASPSVPTQYAHPIPAKGAPHLPPVPIHHPYAHHHYYAYHQHMAAANASANDPKKKNGGTNKSSNSNPLYKKPGAGGESTTARGKQTGPPPMYPAPPPHLQSHHHAYHAWAAYRYAQQHAQYHGGPPPPPPPGPPPPWNAEAYTGTHQAYATGPSKAVATTGVKGNKGKGSPGEKGVAATGAAGASLIHPPPHPAIFPPPPAHTGPYRFSDCTLRREALARSVAENTAKKKSKFPTSGTSSNTSSPSSSIPPHNAISASPSTPTSSIAKNGVVGAPMMVGPNQNQHSSPDAATLHMLELEARAEGATSPSQIEDFHKEEVATMGCTCKKTKCLKLYCQCFAVKIYCGPNCRCLTCNNNLEHENERQDAIRAILARNPTAFDTKFQKNNRKIGAGMINPGALLVAGANAGAGSRGGPRGILSSMDIPHQRTISHKVGCKCRKSACMKKYCECYASNVKCSSTCRCVGCKNMPLGGFGPPPGANTAATTRNPATMTNNTPTKSTIATPVKKEPAWMMNAAQNLAFLKHGSAEKPKRIISRAPSEAGSMPSESSSEESPVAGANKIKTTQGARSLPIPSTAERAAVNALQSSEKTAVNALLMAAMAMTEMSGHDQKSGNDHTSSENQQDSYPSNGTSGVSAVAHASPLNKREKNTSHNNSPEATIRAIDDHFETPQRNLLKKFMSPKRKASDRNTESCPSTNGNNSANHVESRSQESYDACTQNGELDEDSPKREHPGDGTPSLLQKVKRSRLGSLKKGGRLLDRAKSNGDERVLETTSTTSEVLPMEMATPAKDKGGVKIADLTPVSARCIDFKNMRMNDSTSDRAVVDSIDF